MTATVRVTEVKRDPVAESPCSVAPGRPVNTNGRCPWSAGTYTSPRFPDAAPDTRYFPSAWTTRGRSTKDRATTTFDVEVGHQAAAPDVKFVPKWKLSTRGSRAWDLPPLW